VRYSTWYRASINLGLGEEWSEADLREASSATGRACGQVVELETLVVPATFGGSNVPGLLTTVVSPPLGPLLFGAVVYVAAIIAVLAEIGGWTLPLLGVTVGWAVASAGVMFFTVGDPVSDQD
jgi:hypothetical protein